MSKVEFSSVEFEFNHGAKPRGRGRWGFFFGPGEAHLFWAGSAGEELLLFSEAKRQAMAAARESGFSSVKVAS